jgi:hypothetical protein
MSSHEKVQYVSQIRIAKRGTSTEINPSTIPVLKAGVLGRRSIK